MNRTDLGNRVFEEREVFRLTFQGVNEIVAQFEAKLFGLAGQAINLASVTIWSLNLDLSAIILEKTGCFNQSDYDH